MASAHDPQRNAARRRRPLSTGQWEGALARTHDLDGKETAAGIERELCRTCLPLACPALPPVEVAVSLYWFCVRAVFEELGSYSSGKGRLLK